MLVIYMCDLHALQRGSSCLNTLFSFTFSTLIFSFLAIFHFLQWTFLNFPAFSVFLAIFHVLKCVFLIFRDFQLVVGVFPSPQNSSSSVEPKEPVNNPLPGTKLRQANIFDTTSQPYPVSTCRSCACSFHLGYLFHHFEGPSS